MNTTARKRLTFAATVALWIAGSAAFAQDNPPTGWRFGGELYFWGASLGGSTTSGTDIDLGIDQIIDSLKMGAMSTLVAQKNDWTLFADMIYLDVGDRGSATATIGPISIPVSASIDLKGFISTAGVGYRFYDQGNTSLDVTGGFRFLWLDSLIKVGVPSIPREVEEKASGNNWDGVVGLRGKTELTDKWSLSYYGDLGAGQSDLTWQALAAIDYNMKRVSWRLGYRYLAWELDGFGPFHDLDLSGPFVGARFSF